MHARLMQAIACGAFAALGRGAAAAAQAQNASKSLLPSQPTELPFPGIGRVVLGFLFTVSLAVLAAWALRRWWPALAQQRTAGRTIRTLDRTVVSTTLSVYVLEIEGDKYIVAEGRSGVSLTRAAQGAAVTESNT